jgi:hypothetical protein
MAFEDRVLERFSAWEHRCRGHLLYPAAVALEPPFVSFPGYRFATPRRDDGRRETRLSGFFSKAPAVQEATPEPEPEPDWRAPEDLAVMQMTAPRSEPRTADLLRLCRQPTAFEILGTEREVVAQWVTGSAHAARWKRAVESCAPDTIVYPAVLQLTTAVVVELGLRTLVMAPLADECVDVAAVLDGLGKDELGLFQVLFEPVENDWGTEMQRALTLESGEPLDADALKLVRRKLSAGPLFAVVVRLGADAETLDRVWEIIADMAGALSALDGDNGFVPLPNEGLPPDEHAADVENRLSRRPGMLLNLDELCALVTPPWDSRCRNLRRNAGRPAPRVSASRGAVSLGVNRFAGAESEVWLSPEHRVRHTHIIGASGTGKSTLLFNMLRQDIERGEGVALLDPHGDLVERVLGVIPAERRDDVVLVDPSDEEHSIGFNILAAHSDFERNLLASDLVSTFRRLSTSWGEQMNSVLRNAILAFLESPRGGTIADMRRFLLDAAFRKSFLGTVADPDVVFYWERAFPQLTGNKSIGPVITRLDEFLSRKPIRLMVSQQENRLDFADILDHSRILLVKLPQGQIGRENANLLGSVVVSKIQQMAMSRQRMKESERRNFWVYLDEFHSFITPSMAEILTGARKYRVGLILAHQELHQLEADREVASAVLANCCTRIAFRVSDRDARELDSGIAHFAAADLQNLGVGEAICRIERSEADFNLIIPEPDPVDEHEAEITREETRRISNAKYARKRSEVEAELREKMQRQMTELPQARDAKSPASETVSEKEPAPAPAASGESTALEPLPEAVVAESAPVSEPPRPVGMGRGGEDHQLIVANLASEASRLGFRSFKECVVEGGRIDLVVQTSRVRIAIEVAVNSNTAQEIENLQKCAGSKMDVIVSVSPHENVCENIEKAAGRSFDSETLARMRFEAPEALIKWIREIAETEKSIVPPDAPKPRIIAGRKVRTRHVEMSPEERRKKEAEEIEVIADLLRKRSSRKDADPP